MDTDKNKAAAIIGRPLAPMTIDEKRRMAELFAHCEKGHIDNRADVARGECSECKRARQEIRK